MQSLLMTTGHPPKNVTYRAKTKASPAMSSIAESPFTLRTSGKDPEAEGNEDAAREGDTAVHQDTPASRRSYSWMNPLNSFNQPE